MKVFKAQTKKQRQVNSIFCCIADSRTTSFVSTSEWYTVLELQTHLVSCAKMDGKHNLYPRPIAKRRSLLSIYWPNSNGHYPASTIRLYEQYSQHFLVSVSQCFIKAVNGYDPSVTRTISHSASIHACTSVKPQMLHQRLRKLSFHICNVSSRCNIHGSKSPPPQPWYCFNTSASASRDNASRCSSPVFSLRKHHGRWLSAIGHVQGVWKTMFLYNRLSPCNPSTPNFLLLNMNSEDNKRWQCITEQRSSRPHHYCQYWPQCARAPLVSCMIGATNIRQIRIHKVAV